jgi:DNA-binding MarR family transcriptional regulator
MSTPPSLLDAFTLASRFLQAFESVAQTLTVDHITSRFEHLNVSQVRIFQLVHDVPDIRADKVTEHVNVSPDTAQALILAMESMGLLKLDRSATDGMPRLQVGQEGQRAAFQIRATQLSILAEMFGKLPENHRVATVGGLEQLAKQQR